jgi:hypothetical protein
VCVAKLDLVTRQKLKSVTRFGFYVLKKDEEEEEEEEEKKKGGSSIPEVRIPLFPN